MNAKKLRCAIYTRKSTDEGLDQTFNSLDAQREACAAYVLSQTGEGWIASKEIYDDGGYSGGTMDRPALVKLLGDVEAGRVDVIVVYKIDRLTRSLADFVRIVEVLDRAGVSFVSVTQAFNTTTSMGRLTLNVLLSFAQFEREVTAERIRDKIAASKAKGMWMGGHPPLGYDIRDRALHINADEAIKVRHIFERYLQVRSVFDLRDELAKDGIRSKRWTSTTGRIHGDCAFTHGALNHILANRLYLGEIVHRKKTYPGRHGAIIAAELFDEVQAKRKAGAPPMPGSRARGYALPLLGRIFDDRGNPMTTSYGWKGSHRYHYYASTGHTRRTGSGSLPRVSAPRLHQALIPIIDPSLGAWMVDASPERRALDAIERIIVGKGAVAIDLKADAVIEGGSTHLDTQLFLGRNANRSRLIDAADAKAPRVDRALVRGVVMAKRWADELASGGVRSIEVLAKRDDLCVTHLGKLLPLAFLAPDLVEQILDGRQPPRLTLSALTLSPLPIFHAEQRAFVASFA